MLAAIAAAKVSVGMSSYIFQDDLWGGRFIEVLAEAKSRGVEVRVLIDGVGGGWLRSPAYHQLRRRGVTAARFMHSSLPWRMPFLNLRSHKKVLLVDGVVGFTGGMNIADENVMATRPKMPVQDLHFRIEGPVVSQLAEAFAEDWAFAASEELEGDAWLPRIPPRRGPLGRVIDSGPDEDLEKVEFAVLQAVACARASIAVMTPYFLPDERLITALALAAMRGVMVDIVVPEQSNHVLVDWALRANIGPLLSDGVRMWRSPSPFHHDKIMVVDQEWCLVGSCNWDIRSFRLNFELCVEVYDRDLATMLTAFMRRARGSELTQAELDARALPVRLRDAGARLMLPYL
jgi:cardiolipin synthase